MIGMRSTFLLTLADSCSRNAKRKRERQRDGGREGGTGDEQSRTNERPLRQSKERKRETLDAACCVPLLLLCSEATHRLLHFQRSVPTEPDTDVLWARPSLTATTAAARANCSLQDSQTVCLADIEGNRDVRMASNISRGCSHAQTRPLQLLPCALHILRISRCESQ